MYDINGIILKRTKKYVLTLKCVYKFSYVLLKSFNVNVYMIIINLDIIKDITVSK